MGLNLDPETYEYIRQHRIGRLATADAHGKPLVVPVCYVLEGEHLYSSIDAKPKTVSLMRLERVRNVTANPRFSLVIDDYSEDWSRLSYVLVSGNAEIIGPDDPLHAPAVTALRNKYEQYRAMDIESRPIIKMSPNRIKQWASGPSKLG